MTLEACVRAGDLAAAADLVRSGADVNRPAPDGPTPLMIAWKGAGVALLPRAVVEEAADEGRLTIWSTVPHRTSEIWVLHASRRLASTKVTAFVDFIVETLGEKCTESVTTTQSSPRKSNRFR